jgi:hypothetical protein
MYYSNNAYSLYKVNQVVQSGGGSAYSNKSFTFDGVDDRIICGNSLDYTFGDGVNDYPFSISAWIKPTRTGVSFPIINKVYNNGSQDEWELRTLGTDAIRFVLYKNDVLNRRGRDTTIQTTALQDWCHIVGTYDGRGGSTAYDGIKIYVNSIRSDATNTSKNTYTAMSNKWSSVKIGHHDDYNLWANGLIDEVAIFNSELSQTDVNDIFNNGVPSALPNPISHWRMGEDATWNGTDWTLNNNGSGGNNGTSQNMSQASRTNDTPT